MKGPRERASRSGGASLTRELLQRLDGDETHDAWVRLVERVDARLRVVLYFERRNASDDDVLQETWTAALAQWEQFEYRGRGSLQRWIAGILRNKLREARRAEPRERTPRQRATTDNPNGLFDAVAARCVGPATQLMHADALQRVVKALERLPDVEREVVLERVFHATSGKELAARLGVDESTVSVRLTRALEKLARSLRDFAP